MRKYANFIIRYVVTITTFAGFSISPSSAQKSGVFKTYADYQSGTMEFGINCATESHKITLNDFLGKDYITVIHEGKPYKLNKAEVWGYQLCDEKIVRFKGKEHFSVNDQGTLWVYVKQTIVPTSFKNNTSKTINNYYFSKGGGGEIKELLIINLKSAFPDNHKLHDAIDNQFKTDASLWEFDKFHNQYKINHFLENQNLN